MALINQDPMNRLPTGNNLAGNNLNNNLPGVLATGWQQNPPDAGVAAAPTVAPVVPAAAPAGGGFGSLHSLDPSVIAKMWK